MVNIKDHKINFIITIHIFVFHSYQLLISNDASATFFMRVPLMITYDKIIESLNQTKVSKNYDNLNFSYIMHTKKSTTSESENEYEKSSTNTLPFQNISS